ncbi:hypothetical protein PTKIN_Ptkin18bG0098100 [Pterospermum kingtungense]
MKVNGDSAGEMVQLVVVGAPSSNHVKNPEMDQTALLDWGRMFLIDGRHVVQSDLRLEQLQELQLLNFLLNLHCFNFEFWKAERNFENLEIFIALEVWFFFLALDVK